MDWFKYIWLVFTIIAYVIWTIRAINNAVKYIKKRGFKYGFKYAMIYNDWFETWFIIHMVILIGIILASFIYFIATL